jgi:hypothetical protein
VKKYIRHGCRSDVNPWPIAAGSSVPTPFVGTIPVSMVEKDVHCCIRAKIDIRCRYDNNWRRRSEYNREEECPKNTLRFLVKYSEFPIYDINPFLVEY